VEVLVVWERRCSCVRMLGVRRGDLGTYFRRSQFEPLVSTLLDDPVLADVPKNATVSDIDTLFGVELGSAMKVSILKLDGTHFGTYPFHSLRAILC
jgi:U11/U12 small nuclear ribonucleoprotein SNRNP25